ncbi:MAG TPA: hypothetical protein IAA60_00015 [Candidatus Ornithomonoglobus intestinigallinarum]|uniref:Uncharacterized protein n=1 Tax=Candidatus Ornithomonoglobus intestinigallinarum TaxID=2840894 RepID=A0A9D1KNW9_9FIRM|nr:hypothetical protein [Candidatus Ornithomonoglobus intestinigallinarum]
MKKIINLVTAVAIAVSSALVTVPAMAADTYSEEWGFENTVFDGNNGDGLYRWPTNDNEAGIVGDGGVNGSKGFKLATTNYSQLYKQGLDLTEGVYEFGASVRLTKSTPHARFRFGSGDKADKDNTAFTIAEINNGSINLNGNQQCAENKIAKTIKADTWYTLDAIVDLDSKYCLVTVTDDTGSVYAKNRYTITNNEIGWFGFNISDPKDDNGDVYVDDMYIKSFNGSSIVLVDDDFSSYTQETGELPYFGGGYPEKNTYERAKGDMVEKGALELTGGHAVRYMPTMLSSGYTWLTPDAPFADSGKLKIEFNMNVASADNGQITVDIKNKKRVEDITPLFADKSALVDGSSGTPFANVNYSTDQDMAVEIIYNTADGSYTTTLKNADGTSETLTGKETLPENDTSVSAVWINCIHGTVTIDDLKITHIINEEPAEPEVITGEQAKIAQVAGKTLPEGMTVEDGQLTLGDETISAWTITAAADKFKTGDTIKATLTTGKTSSSKLGIIPTVDGGDITFYVLINKAADSVESVEFIPAQ